MLFFQHIFTVIIWAVAIGTVTAPFWVPALIVYKSVSKSFSRHGSRHPHHRR